MRLNSILHILLAGIAGSLPLASPSSAQAVELSDAHAAVLQVDGPAATRHFAQLLSAPASLSAWEQRRARCSIARLAGRPSIPAPALSGDELADRIIGIYRSYWRAAMDVSQRARAEQRLFDELRKAIRRPDLKDRDAVLREVSAQLNARNIYTTLGKTAALYDLLLYLNQEEQLHKVDLSDGTSHDVKVFLMKSMMSYGWSRYFNCGGPGTGGFAVENGLYAVAETYDLDGEGFLVSFLSHETRHFADYKRYPGLEGPELEYRAKLTELARVDKTLPGILSLFDSSQSDNRENPHSHANRRVLGAMRKQLGLPPEADLKKADPVRLREAARSLLVQDNAERDKADGK
jgi:hypothetical protein